jgi:Leucine-rich repeat (LRR) protein
VSSIDLNVCTWLRRLHINTCGLIELPRSIALLTDLLELDLYVNRLTSIDVIDFSLMSKLTKLDVSSFCHLFAIAQNANHRPGSFQSTWTVVEKQLESRNVVG